jgi:hypothetical protein
MYCMYIETVPNRNSPPAILLREGFREGAKIIKRTLANLSHWDAQLVEHFRLLLKGGVAVESIDAVMTIERTLPHGHVAAVLGAARACGAVKWFASAPEELRSVLLAMLCARVLWPASKLATHRMLHDDSATSSLGRVLGVGQCEVDELYRALDWLHQAQPSIERALARSHLVGSTLVLYDLTSTWLTGHCCELAARGHSRDSKHDDPQIVFGLVCTADGVPICVEVFAGNTGDPSTVASQVTKVKERFGIERIAWVGDRGMLTCARIEKVLRPQAQDWISSLRAPHIAQLAAEHGPFQPSLFDERNLIELSSEQFPGERLIVCRNPLLAEERARKRGELLAATELDLAKIAAGHPAPQASPAHREGDRLARGPRRQSLPHGQALRTHHHRHRADVDAQGRCDRRRGRAGRPVCDPHQPQRRPTRRPGHRGRVQEPGQCGAGLPLHEDDRSACAPGVPLQLRARARPRLPLHAGLLRRVARPSSCST